MTNLSPSLGLVPLVPGQSRQSKFARVFGSVISIGALRCAPLTVILDISAFANTRTGIASERKATETPSFRIIVHLLFLQHWLWKLSIRSWTQQKNKYPNRSTQFHPLTEL